MDDCQNYLSQLFTPWQRIYACDVGRGGYSILHDHPQPKFALADKSCRG